jgi:hypothetical protein
MTNVQKDIMELYVKIVSQDILKLNLHVKNVVVQMRYLFFQSFYYFSMDLKYFTQLELTMIMHNREKIY